MRFFDLWSLRDPAISSPWRTYPTHLESVVWHDILSDSDYLPPTCSEAMSVPAVARARQLIVGTIAPIPLRFYRGPDPQITPYWVDRSDRPQSAFDRMLWTVDDLFFHGWSLWTLVRDYDGRVSEAIHLPYPRWSFDEAGRVLIGDQLAPARSVCLIPGIDEGLLCRVRARSGKRVTSWSRPDALRSDRRFHRATPDDTDTDARRGHRRAASAGGSTSCERAKVSRTQTKRSRSASTARATRTCLSRRVTRSPSTLPDTPACPRRCSTRPASTRR